MTEEHPSWVGIYGHATSGDPRPRFDSRGIEAIESLTALAASGEPAGEAPAGEAPRNPYGAARCAPVRDRGARCRPDERRRAGHGAGGRRGHRRGDPPRIGRTGRLRALDAPARRRQRAGTEPDGCGTTSRPHRHRRLRNGPHRHRRLRRPSPIPASGTVSSSPSAGRRASWQRSPPGCGKPDGAGRAGRQRNVIVRMNVRSAS